MRFKQKFLNFDEFSGGQKVVMSSNKICTNNVAGIIGSLE